MHTSCMHAHNLRTAKYHTPCVFSFMNRLWLSVIELLSGRSMLEMLTFYKIFGFKCLNFYNLVFRSYFTWY